ncbi:ABC transporter ATP-binding protein [Desertimonas flava]|uniref:ABC transporter ATP-binding protein n=1 Tax=Desertimonas flava TaxID=2064846 RepID=UPI00196906D2|nr:ABC transporter ATP-binding protein [Desertimonas flava]
MLHGVSFDLVGGELLTIVGANGAGKSTLLKALSGLRRAMAGSIQFDGVDITRWSPARIVAAGLVQVPENRRLFPASTVMENLRLGGYVRRRHRAELAADIDAALEMFPILAERSSQRAGALSGGEQQMLTISMGLMARPRLLVLDEPSLGLAPVLVERVLEHIHQLHQHGTTVLLVEQLADKALGLADRGIVMKLGEIVAAGSAAELRNDPSIRQAYLGNV